MEVYKRDPASLGQDERVELAAYLQVYAFERLDAVSKLDAKNGLDASHSLAIAQASVASLLSGEQALGYGYPYAGSNQDKLAWADAQRSQMGPVENLGWARDRGVDEQTYLDAKSSLRIGEQQQGLANLGDPAIYFLTGSIGSTVRAAAATNGALQFTQGAKQAVDGDGWNAAGNMVAGLLGMATLGVPAVKGGARAVGAADSKVGGGAKGGAVSSGAENAALYPKLKDQLIQENLSNIAAQDSRLAAAVSGSGTRNPNFSIGTGSAAEANSLGRIWVGDGARPISSVPGGLISADGTRVYRPPTAKPNTPAQYNPTGVQANFQTLQNGKVIRNGHLSITN